MDQRITVKIAEREYVIMAPSPESEELIRLAASAINKKISAYTAKFPGKNMIDILSFVALNESIGSLSVQRKFEALNAEINNLKKDTDTYLENIEKSSR